MVILPPGPFSVIAADPAWEYVTYSKKNQTRSAENHYKTMTLDEIKAFPVASLAADNCVLLLWAINPMLPHALDVMKEWGFKYATVGFTWAKLTPKSGSWAPKYHMGMGHWARANSELCLLGTRGKPKRRSKGVRQLIVSPRRRHSEKPEEFYESVEKLLDGPYLDLFSRLDRPNWTAVGDEVGKLNLPDAAE